MLFFKNSLVRVFLHGCVSFMSAYCIPLTQSTNCAAPFFFGGILLRSRGTRKGEVREWDSHKKKWNKRMPGVRLKRNKQFSVVAHQIIAPSPSSPLALPIVHAIDRATFPFSSSSL